MNWNDQLKRARTHYENLRLAESYAILRRFFDRLPFEQQPEHTEFIGIFVRILCELGKNHELEFYLRELERLSRASPSPELKYQLGVVCMDINPPKMEKAKQLFEAILREPGAKVLHPKAKMMLADYFDRVQCDKAMCRSIIHSIDPVVDPDIQRLVDIWRAKVLMDEGRYEPAKDMLHSLLNEISLQQHWYPYFCSQLILANILILENRLDEAFHRIVLVRNLFHGKRLKTLQVQLQRTEKLLEQRKVQKKVQRKPSMERRSSAERKTA